MKRRIFLDHNSTTYMRMAVRVAVSEMLAEPCNASSVHSFGRETRKNLHDARLKVSKMVNANDVDVVFTSTGTEANNLVMSGFKGADSIAVSAVEHISILKPAEMQNKTSIIPVNSDGLVELGTLQKVIQNARGKTLVSVMMANNETGIIQPIKEIAELVRKCGGYTHCDAVQGVGKIAVDFDDLGVDMMTVSSHKIGGMHGAAALIKKKGLELEPQIVGGMQENGLRAGTENMPAIMAFGVAAELVEEDMPCELRDYLEAEIAKIADAEDFLIVGANSPRLPNTSCIAIRNCSSETQLINFDLAGIAVSNGSACSSGTVKKSHVMKAMGVEESFVSSVIRVSLSHRNTQEEIDQFLSVWKSNYLKVKEKLQGAA